MGHTARTKRDWLGEVAQAVRLRHIYGLGPHREDERGVADSQKRFDLCASVKSVALFRGEVSQP